MTRQPAATSTLHDLERAQYTSLTTFRKNGEGVATPVWFAVDGNQVYIETSPRSGKVKRILRASRVTLARCTLRGKVTGPVLEGTARILESESERARAESLIARKYGLVRRLNYGLADVLRRLQRKPKGQFAYIAVTLG